MEPVAELATVAEVGREPLLPLGTCGLWPRLRVLHWSESVTLRPSCEGSTDRSSDGHEPCRVPAQCGCGINVYRFTTISVLADQAHLCSGLGSDRLFLPSALKSSVSSPSSTEPSSSPTSDPQHLMNFNSSRPFIRSTWALPRRCPCVCSCCYSAQSSLPRYRV